MARPGRGRGWRKEEEEVDEEAEDEVDDEVENEVEGSVRRAFPSALLFLDRVNCRPKKGSCNPHPTPSVRRQGLW